MSDLVERYVQQVGLYLAPQERAEIEAELRSLINDQLEDRYVDNPSEADISTVLMELGAPYQMAASYNSDRYLVGPELYPFMMMVLRYGWLTIPAVVFFLGVFGALSSSGSQTVVNVLLEPIGAAVQVAFVFSSVVVLIFALIQRWGMDIHMEEPTFDPLKMPKLDDPTVVDRTEASFGVSIGTFMILVLLYFLQVDGLTLRFDLSDPGDVIPFPLLWMVFLIIAVVGQIVTELVVLWRNYWTIRWWLIQTVLEVFGVICLYFAILEPVAGRIARDNEVVSIFANWPEIFAIGYAVIALVVKGFRLGRLLGGNT